MDKRPIGIFDSGIGGLTVLKEYIKLLPNENYIYYADTKHLPYGDKTKEQIIEYSKNIVKYFISENVKAIIIACGTASSLAYQYLKEHFDVPIFNIIEPVARNIKDKNIGIIATKGSINSKVWENEILKFNPRCNITAIACPKLVPIAENGLIHTLETKNVVKDYLSVFKDKRIDSLILGCTHYPLFKDLIQENINKEINLINVGTYSAQEFKTYLETTNSLNATQKQGKIEYFVSGDKNIFMQNATIILGQDSLHILTSI